MTGVLASWDGFVAAAEEVDLGRSSRLPGWTGLDVLGARRRLAWRRDSGHVAGRGAVRHGRAAVRPGRGQRRGRRRAPGRAPGGGAGGGAAVAGPVGGVVRRGGRRRRAPGARPGSRHVRGRPTAAAHRRQRQRLRARGARPRPRGTPGRAAARRRPGGAGRRDRRVRAPARVAVVARRVDGPVRLAGPDRPRRLGHHHGPGTATGCGGRGRLGGPARRVGRTAGGASFAGVTHHARARARRHRASRPYRRRGAWSTRWAALKAAARWVAGAGRLLRLGH